MYLAEGKQLSLPLLHLGLASQNDTHPVQEQNSLQTFLQEAPHHEKQTGKLWGKKAVS